MTMRMEAPRIPMTELQQTELLPDGPEKEGRSMIEDSGEFQSMREVQRTLSAHLEPFAKKRFEIERDRDLNDEGRSRRLAAIDAEREERINAVLTEYGAREKILLNRYADVDPRPLPIQGSDANRLQVALAKLPHLTPERIIENFRSAVDRKDHVWLQEMLPVLESYASKPDYESYAKQIPIGEADPIKDLSSKARNLLTGPNQYAARYAREALPKMRAEVDKVVNAIRTEGAWQGSVAQRTQAEVAGHAVPSLSWLEE